MAEYRLKPGKVGEKVIGAYEKVEKKFTDAFLEYLGYSKGEPIPTQYLYFFIFPFIGDKIEFSCVIRP